MNELKPRAVFIADSHTAPYRPQLLSLLKSLNEKPPIQLFLMGDMFDVLVGNYPDSVERNREALDLISELAQKSEVFYFEGNHDYNLKSTLPGVKVYDRYEQPVFFEKDSLVIGISHGDVLSGRFHALYMRMIKSVGFVALIQWMNRYVLKNGIWSQLDCWLQKKNICYPFDGFEKLAQKRLKKYRKIRKVDVVIEGHYHQDKNYYDQGTEYINLGAHACNQSYYLLESTANEIVLQKAKSKEF